MSDYFDLGTYTRQVSAQNPEAMLWVNRGLIWAYAYHFEAALDSFRRAIGFDRGCLLAYWGVAYASGCNYNKPWRVFSPSKVAGVMREAREAIERGRRCRDRATPCEVALLDAIAQRFQAEGAHSEATLLSWNARYADAMRSVYLDHPNDLDVAALFADALINQSPWKLWDFETSQPMSTADTEEATTVLVRALALADSSGIAHPGLLHTHIHVMELSPTPERALRSADALRELVPASGHLQHMASHIDVVCGNYSDAIVANRRAIAADRAFMPHAREMFDYLLYCAHNVHFAIYAAMLAGQSRTALRAADEMDRLITESLLRVEDPPMACLLESMVSVRLHVLIRFGRWQDILRQQTPADEVLYCNTIAMLHYARGIAQANMGNSAAAAKERSAFMQARARVPGNRYIFNNTCQDVLEVARCMLDGEVEFHAGNRRLAFQHLRQAVYFDDHLEYMEPWGWMMPTRHALGALLLADGQVEAALAVYRADLGLDSTLYRALQHPNNVWSLHGYVTCLRQLGKREEAALVEPMLAIALGRTDVEITSSCYCAAAARRTCCQ